VKALKDKQRATMSADSAMKQATLYSSYCSERAEAMKTNQSIKSHWEEDDFRSLGLDKYLVDVDIVTGNKKEKRIFYNFVQEWEKDTFNVKSHHSEILLRNKYGGMKYYDMDHDNGRFESRTIDVNTIAWQGKRNDKCYYVVGRVDHLPDDHNLKEEVWEIGEDLHDCIHTYYRMNPDPNIELVTASQFAGKSNEHEDYSWIDEWIANGGISSSQLEELKKRKRSASAGQKRKTQEIAKKKAPGKQIKKRGKTPSNKVEANSSSSSSSDGENQEQKSRRSKRLITLKESSSDENTNSD
jgi:hypothetical protein